MSTPWSLAATGRDLADLDTWPREGRPSRVVEVPYDPEGLKPDEEPLERGGRGDVLTCAVCEGRRWVWEFVADEAVSAPCPRCGVVEPPTEADVQRMYEQRTRRAGEGHAA